MRKVLQLVKLAIDLLHRELCVLRRYHLWKLLVAFVILVPKVSA